jgi:hypothetical protein
MNKTFKEYYIEEGMMDTISDMGKTVKYFGQRFLLLLKSKDKKAKLIEILKEMKEDYNYYYKSFMTKVDEIVYTNYKAYKRDSKFRYDVQVFLMVLISLGSVPISLNILSALKPEKYITQKIQQHHSEIIKELEDVKRSTEQNSSMEQKPEFDVNNLGF